ncbi:MAG: diguanylate cyclase [Acetobacterium woodii]|nr:diguanylate cyclase [Acetobacterium woodii]
MDSEQYEKTPIYFGEFREEALEKKFYQVEIARNFNLVRLAILGAALLSLLMIMPEHDLIKDPHDFMTAAIISGLMTTALIFLFFKVTWDKGCDTLSYWFTGYEIMIGLSLIYIISNLMRLDFMFQVISLIVMILFVFLISNRWLYAIFTSFLLSISYFVFVALVLKNAPATGYLTAAVFVLVIILTSSVASYRTNYYKRFHYLNLMELLRMAELDALTGIYNKAKFNNDFGELTDRARCQQGHLSIVMFDIDNFKEINDQYGHLVGDAILLELANFIQKHIRITDIFVRWGGDKFILTFPDTPLQLAAEIAEKLRVMIGEHPFEEVGHLSCSFGVAAFRDGDELDSLVRRADERLYMAKKEGKNKVVQG